MNKPVGVLIDSSGNIIVSDTNNNVIRYINSITNNITTIVGNGNEGYFGGNGTDSLLAELNKPTGIYIDKNNFLYIADTGNEVVRRVIPDNPSYSSSTIYLEAGTPNQYGFSGNSPLYSTFNNPVGIFVDNSLTFVYVADSNNNVIRKFTYSLDNTPEPQPEPETEPQPEPEMP